MAHTTEKIIDKIKELKETVLPSGKLILFGSQARVMLLLTLTGICCYFWIKTR